MFPGEIGTPSPKLEIPESWRWALDIIDEAHLLYIGLPVKWVETQWKHIKKAFDPATNEIIDIVTAQRTKLKESPVGFIMSTKGYNPMPGAESPATIRYTRYSEAELHRAIVKDPRGNELVPCIVHGDFVKVEALESYHIKAKEEIFRRQKALVDKLNDKSDPGFAKFLMKQEGMEKFFVQVGDKYFGTLFFYELYFNDIDNIWLICDACNLHKGKRNTIAWLKEQWLYGQEFLDYLGLVKDDAILAKTQDNRGLAQVAIEWFWSRHANYISVAKKLFENVVRPIQILNIQIDHVIGSGKQQRVERLQASLEARLLLLTSIAQAPGLGIPKYPDESSHDSSDNNARMSPLMGADDKPVYPTPDQFTRAIVSVSKDTPRLLKTKLKENLRDIMQTEKQVDRPDEDSGDEDLGKEKDTKRPKIDGGHQ